MLTTGPLVPAGRARDAVARARSLTAATFLPRRASIADYRDGARRRLPPSVFDFIDGGAGDDVTVHDNDRAFRDVRFRPSPLVDVSRRDTTVEVLGRRLALPVILGPAGVARLAHRDGELALARAAARAGTAYALTAGSGYTLEEVADAGKGATLWYQAYLWKDIDVVEDLVRRAERAGFHALCVTIDVPISGLKYRDLRNGMSLPPRIAPREMLTIARRPRWLYNFAKGRPVAFANMLPYGFDPGSVLGLSTFMQTRLNNPSVTWDDLRWLRRLWNGPLVVKGVLTGPSARMAFDCGADAVVCSNHGGRQLAGNTPSLVALPEVVEVADAAGKEVFIDGGVRSGGDVLKAVALGARACLVARPYFWGLATGGEDGVVEVLDLYRREIDNVLAQLGTPTLADVGPSVVTMPYDMHAPRRP